MFKLKKTKTGFTLVEMLVVIAVIGVLAAIVYASFSNSRAQARDRIRMEHMKQLQVALELYKDKYGRYPARGCVSDQAVAPWWSGNVVSSAQVAGCQNYIVGHANGINFVPDFIEELPTDPRPSTLAGRGLLYRTDAVGTMYAIMYNLSVESLLVYDKTHPFARAQSSQCASTPPEARTYFLSSPSRTAACW